MKKLLLLPLIFTFIACGGTDDETDNAGGNMEDNRTFLEKYDGFGYYFEDDGVFDYYFFSDSPTFLRYVEVYNEDPICNEFQEGTNNRADGDVDINISIVTNDSSSLLIQLDYTYDGQSMTESLEFTVDGNTLSIKYDNDPNDVSTFTKTSTTFASLCD